MKHAIAKATADSTPTAQTANGVVLVTRHKSLKAVQGAKRV